VYGRGRRLVIACTAATGDVRAAPPPRPPNVSLGIVFPEGWTVREMTARVAAVSRIALTKRHVQPVLTARAYSKAAAAALPPSGFRRSLKRRSIEGFLFPSRYDFGPSTSASELIALQLAAFRGEWAKVRLGTAVRHRLSAYDVLIVASMIERETVVPAERALVSAVIYNRLAADIARDRRDAPVRARRSRHQIAHEKGPREPDAVQHAAPQRLAADADRQSRPRLAPGRRASGAGGVPLLRAQTRQAASLLHGERRRVLREGA
jgi:hypothetical protein